jgi:hypothetical protein
MPAQGQKAAPRELLDHAGQDADLRRAAQRETENGNAWIFGLSGPLSGRLTGG